MNRKQLFFRVDRFGLILGAALLGTLSGCIGYEQREKQLEARDGSAGVQTTFAVEDDYVYYPNYECYYSESRHQFAYRDGRNWVSRPAPRGVSVDVLIASPSVRMNFHDSPAQHHATVVKQYPKNWKPSAEKPAQNENRRDEQHDQH